MEAIRCRYCGSCIPKIARDCNACGRRLEGAVVELEEPAQPQKAEIAPTKEKPLPPKSAEPPRSFGDRVGTFFMWILVISFVLGNVASCFGFGGSSGGCRYGECDDLTDYPPD